MSSFDTNAPRVGPPNPADYADPEIDRLNTEITNLQAQPDITFDTTQFDTVYGQQQSFLQTLQDIASGKQQTQGEILGRRAEDISNKMIRGRAQSFEGSQAVGAQRAVNQAAARQTLNIRSTTEQVAAVERVQAQNQAQNQMAVMQNEQLAKQQGELQVQQLNEQRHQALIQDQIAVGQLKQAANQRYQADLAKYQEQQRQYAMKKKELQDNAIASWIGGGLKALGGAVLTVVGALTVEFGVGAPIMAGGVALLASGVGDIAQGVTTNNASAAM